MTPLTKRRHSTARQGRRRRTISLVLPQLTACTNCHQPRPSHRSCPHCGFYKGRKIS